jgi:hypothetical protein
VGGWVGRRRALRGVYRNLLIGARYPLEHLELVDELGAACTARDEERVFACPRRSKDQSEDGGRVRALGSDLGERLCRKDLLGLPRRSLGRVPCHAIVSM